MKKYIAEFIGTCVLTIFGCGSAVAANTLVSGTGLTMAGSPLALSTLLIAFAFGLSIVAMAYSIGNISGCHINPAVSIAMWVSKKLSTTDFIGYLIAQFAGATVGAALLCAFFGDMAAHGTNGFGTSSALGTPMGGAFLVEFVLTYVFVTAIMGVTSKTEFSSTTGLVIGLTLTLVHILGIPFTGTSVNPARSFGPALLALIGGDAVPFAQLWVFIVAPLLGGVVAAVVYNYLASDK